MRIPGNKSRWIQGSLAVLIILILTFLAVSPNLRAEEARERQSRSSELNAMEWTTPRTAQSKRGEPTR